MVLRSASTCAPGVFVQEGWSEPTNLAHRRVRPQSRNAVATPEVARFSRDPKPLDGLLSMPGGPSGSSVMRSVAHIVCIQAGRSSKPCPCQVLRSLFAHHATSSNTGSHGTTRPSGAFRAIPPIAAASQSFPTLRGSSSRRSVTLLCPTYPPRQWSV